MKSDKTFLMLFAIFILSLAIVYGQSFDVSSASKEVSICPRTTELFVDSVKNLASGAQHFTVNIAGSAASFATSVPAGFVLAPGQSKAIYTYVTPFSTTAPGSYDLKVKISTSEGVKEIVHEVNVLDCHTLEISGGDKKEACPGETLKFEAQITNTGLYQEIYEISVKGEIAEYVTLSENIVAVNSSSSRTVYAYVKLPVDIEPREYEFTIEAKSEKALQSRTFKVEVMPCYDFELNVEKNSVSFCEHSKQEIELTIKNKGTSDNSFTIKVDGPLWASVENTKLNVKANSIAKTNLVFVPDYGVEGSFDIGLEVIPEKGIYKAKDTVYATVEKCHSVLLNIKKDSDKICNGLSNSYAVLIKNDGKVAKDYGLEVKGATWASLEKTKVSLKPGEEQEVLLTINPGINVKPDEYGIKVVAFALDDSKVKDEDTITITTISTEDCYKPSISIETKDVEVYYDGSATVPIVVQNQGNREANYEIGISDNAASFVQISPAVVKLAPGESEVVYAYVAPTVEMKKKQYKVTVTARLPNSTILASESFNVKISEIPVETLPTGAAVAKPEKKSIWQRIKGFFARLFGKKPVETEISKEAPINVTENITTNITTEANVTENITTTKNIPRENIIENITTEKVPENVSAENITEQANVTKVENITEENVTAKTETPSENVTQELVNLDVSDVINVNLTKKQEVNFTLTNEEHTIKIEDVANNTALIAISSDAAKYALLFLNEPKEIDINNDGLPDVRITLTYAQGDNVSLKIEKIQPKKESFVEKIKRYQTPIVVAIVVIILAILIWKTRFHKKVVEFFEEEVEEEGK